MLKKGQKSLIILFVFAIATVIVWQLPGGMMILYPFTLLSTWFHEMGHGIMALLLGGHLIRIEVYANGSGLAEHSGELFLGPFGRALVAAAGPLAATMIGSFMLIKADKAKLAKWTLLIIGILMLGSVALWIRGFMPILVLIILGALLVFIALKGNAGVKKITMQFLGVQAFMSFYLSIGYLFSSGADVGGYSLPSDTQAIANNLLLPFWFWGAVLLAIWAIMINYTIKKVLNK
jgi:sensor histidine kinase YesM